MDETTPAVARQVERWVMHHTPGPWFADKPFYHSGERQRVTPIYARDPKRLDGRWLVAWCHQNAVPAKEVKPNACLLAAAPDLLEAAEAALNCVAELPENPARAELAQMLTAAISKALGRDA